MCVVDFGWVPHPCVRDVVCLCVALWCAGRVCVCGCVRKCACVRSAMSRLRTVAQRAVSRNTVKTVRRGESAYSHFPPPLQSQSLG